MATADLPILSKLTTEAKKTLLGALLLDLAESGEDVRTVEAGGRTFSVYVPLANAREMARQAMLACTPEERAEMDRRAADTDPKNWLSFDEFFQLISEDLDRLSQSPESSSPDGERVVLPT